MLTNLWVYLALFGMVIIVVLAAIATKLMRQLNQQTFISTLRSKLFWGEDKRNYM